MSELQGMQVTPQLVYQHFMTRPRGSEIEYWGSYVQVAWFSWDANQRWPVAQKVLLFSGVYPDRFKSQISVVPRRLGDYARRKINQGFKNLDPDGGRIIRRDWDKLTDLVETNWPQVHDQVQRKMVWLTLQGEMG